MQPDLFSAAPTPSSWFDELDEGGDPDGLRYYQRDAVNATLRVFEDGCRSALVVMATGMGKTQFFSAIAKHWPGSVLVLAHREELVTQARDRLEQMTGGERVDIEQGDRHSDPRTRLVVGSVDTVKGKRRLERLGKDRFSLIIPDEAHHYLAKTYRRPLDYFDSANILGVTATPDRGDERALGSLFDEVAFVMDIEDGIDAGYLVPIRGRTVVLHEVDLDGIGKSGGDLVASQLDQAMLKAVEGIVAKTLELEPTRQAIGFMPGIQTAEYASHTMNQRRPGSSAFVSGSTPPRERRHIIEAFRAGRLQYLWNCQVATEGFDAPGASCIIQGRPTLSRALYAQMIGRGTRVLPGTVDHLEGPELAAERRLAIAASQKPDMVILDFVGNGSRHELITASDVLGGKYSPAEIKEAKKKAKGRSGADQRALLEEARRELQELARKAQAKVNATVRDFDPFRALGIDGDDGIKTRFGHRPPTEKQRVLLEKLGFSKDDIEGVSRRQASKAIDVCMERRRQGSATLKQVKALSKWTTQPPEAIRFAQASAALHYLASVGWKKDKVDKGILDNILKGTLRA